ncbi:glycosyltransferase family 4 protein [Patescibacteria group bacterium]|nr:glycosyltransferase family 4 protein [Patescibacteria group bacterium]
MKLLYLSNNRFPTEKAHGLQIAKMCEAFLEAEVDLTLIVPRRKQTKHVPVDSAQVFYQLRVEVPVVRLWCIDFLTSKWVPRVLAYFLQSFTFGLRARLALLGKRKEVIYTRTLLPLWGVRRARWFFEAHTFPKTPAGRKFQSIVLRGASGVVCISEGLKEKYEEILPHSVPILVAHDGVDLSIFSSLPEKDEARRRLGLPEDKKIVLYTGSPYKWKGVFTLAKATAKLNDVLAVFVGGNEDEPELKSLSKKAEAARVIPYVPYGMVPDYLAAADVLAIPNSAKDPVGREDTSPLKLFEYMATGKKILASDVPALKRVLSEETAWFFKADDAADLRKELLICLGSEQRRGERAAEEARKYSWKKRVESILEFVS